MKGNETDTNILDTETPPVDDAELDAGFDAEAGGEGTPPEEPADTKAETDVDEGGAPGASEADASPGEGGTPGEGPDLDAYLEEKRRKERDAELDRLLEEKRGGGGGTAEPPLETPGPGGDTGAAVDETEYDLAGRLERLKKDPFLSKQKFKVTEDGEPLTFEEMYSEYGAITELSIALAEAISRDNARAEATRLFEPVQKTLSEREADAETDRLFQDLNDYGHSDAREIAQSEPFWAWVDKQKPEVQGLTRSLDPNDVDMVLKRYKSESGIETAAGGNNGAREQARAAAQRERDLHGGTTHARRRRVPSGGGPGDVTERDLDAAFNEEAEKK